MTFGDVYFYVAVFVLGTILGSFVGAMVWRMKRGEDWVRGRSQCEHCRHQLAAGDLVPIVSYLALKGKCRYCHKPIGRTALLLEIITGLAFLVSTLLYPAAVGGSWLILASGLAGFGGASLLGLGLWLSCLTIMVALATYDIKWGLLPNKLVFPLIGLALAHSVVVGLWLQTIGVDQWLIKLGLGLLPITGVYGLLYLISRGRWIGLGDVKLGVAIGFLLPWWGGVMVLFLANVLGSLVALPGLIRHKLKSSSAMPFGPYLILATYLVFLLGWLVKQIAAQWLV